MPRSRKEHELLPVLSTSRDWLGKEQSGEITVHLAGAQKGVADVDCATGDNLQRRQKNELAPVLGQGLRIF